MILKMDYFKLYHTLKTTKNINSKNFKHFFKTTALHGYTHVYLFLYLQ